MPTWKFWEKERAEALTPAAPEPAAGRFNVRPRTDLVGGALPEDPAGAKRVSALRKRRNGALFDVEQATLAGEPDNSWLERVATIDEAIAAVEVDLRRLSVPSIGTPGGALQPTPVSIVEVEAEPVPRVTLQVGDEELVYVEDLDWAERGHQIAQTEMHLERGSIERLLPSGLSDEERADLSDVLRDSLFHLATDASARLGTLGSAVPPRLLADLARPDGEFGGWVDINGSSPRRRAHAVRLGELTMEVERLRTERGRELEEMARWRERLPVAQRRLRDVDAEIAVALRGEEGGRR